MPRTKILSKTFFAMGTANTITIPEKHADVAEDIRSFIMTLHNLVNVFDDRSELSEINRMAGRQEVTVNPNTFRLLVHAERARLKTGGAFHAGLLPAIQIWKKTKGIQKLPSHFELRKTSHIIKKTEVILNPEKHTVFLKKAGQGIDLGGITKGYAIDRAIEMLRKQNVPEALLNFGGTIYVHGGTCRIGIQNPFAPTGCYMGSLQIQDQAVVTSGIYERYFELGGIRYHHIIDPKTSKPAETDLAGVTLIGKHAGELDALATAVIVSGMETSLKLIHDYKVNAVLIRKDGTVYITDGLKNNLKPESCVAV